MHEPTNTIRLASVLGLALTCATSALRAEAVTADDAASQELLPYVVVATRTPLELDRVSPSVSYISAEEMEFWQDRSLYQSLSRESGVTFTTNGATGNTGSLFIRGTNSNHTALFLDGRRLNPGQFSQYGIETIATETLSSAQLQKGASSVNYGSSGIGGVIDLQTRSALVDGESSISIARELGSNDYHQASIGAAFADDDWGVSFSGSELDTDNERANDAYNRRASTARFDYKLNDLFYAELLAHGVKTKKEEPGSIVSPTPTNENQSESWLISPGIRYANNLLNAHFFYSRSKMSYEGSTAYGSYERWVESDEVNIQVDYFAADDVLLSSGIVHREEEAFNSFAPSINLPFEQTGAYLQALCRLTDVVEVRGGLRYDDFSEFDDKMTQSLEVIYNLGFSTSFFVKAATSYAPPTISDIIFDSNISTPINPEESVSYELGIRKLLLGEKLELNANYFRNEIEELIEWVPDSPGAWSGDTYNVSEALTQGVELNVDYTYNEKLGAYASYTYLHASNEDANERLVKRPRHTVQAGLSYRPAEIVSMGINLTGYYDRVGYGGAELGDFVVVNGVVSWRVTQALTAFARVENLFDKAYELTAGYPSLGRAAYVGARLSF